MPRVRKSKISKRKVDTIRVEILIPIEYNEGTKVSGEIIEGIHDKLMEEFGAFTHPITDYQATHIGYWTNEHHEVIPDKHRLVIIDCLDTSHNRRFFRRFKGQLEVLPKQDLIYVTIHRIEVL